MQPTTKFERVINLKAAKTLGIGAPRSLLALADDNWACTPGQNRPARLTLACLLPPGADVVREKAPMLGTFPLDTSAGFGRLAIMRFRAPPLPLLVAGPGLSTTFLRAPCLGASAPADDSTPTRSPVERTPGGMRPGTPPRQVSVGDQWLGCGCCGPLSPAADTRPRGTGQQRGQQQTTDTHWSSA
jgi:hypothetical protein